MLAWSTLLVGLLPAVVRAQYPNPGLVRGAFTDVHDPSALCRGPDGIQYLFSTAPGIAIRSTANRIDFTYLGLVWPNGAPWTDQYTGTSNGNLWAPDCTYVNGQFFLYYSASSFGSQVSGIYLARSSTGKPGSWTNDGLVTASRSGQSFNAIDPNLVIDGSNWWLVYGSWWQGIAIVPLTPGTGKLLSGGAVTRLATRGNGIEGASLIKQGSFYYLFTSWDACCQGTSSTYNIRAGRSSSITGPYVDQAGVALTNGGGTLILAKHNSVVGPGGQTVFRDGSDIVLNYHYYTPSDSRLGINLLTFASGWPVVY